MEIYKYKSKFISILFLILLMLSIDNFLFSQNTNYALQFDGIDDEVVMGYNSILDNTGDITICVWYKTQSPNWGALVANYDQYSPDNGYELCSSSGYGQGGFVYFECAYNDDRDGFSTNATFNDDQWHHVAAVYTPNGNSRGKVYVDGVLQTGYFWGGSVPLTAIGTTPSYEFKVGAAYGEAYFVGIIDEVSIWDVALTQIQIVENMNKKFQKSDSGLVGYWPFDEGVSNVANDYSGNNNHGTIYGANWVISGAPTGIAFYFAIPNYGYPNHYLNSVIKGVNTHFADSLGTQDVWLSKGSNTIYSLNFQVHDNTSLDAEFYIPFDASYGFWDINIETAVDSTITMPNGIEILPPPKVASQTSNTSSWLKSIDVVDNNACWAVGNNGTIINTTDGGLNWNSQTSSTSNSLNSVFFIDETNGWAAGQSGIILHTSDSGLNWNTQTSNTSNNLQSVYFTDANTGWTVGGNGTIFHTNDGGLNWNVQNSNTSSWLYSVHFHDVNNGMAVGSNGTIIKTMDGGTNWASQSSGVSDYLFSVYFVDSNTGWISGSNGILLKTNDGGSTWTTQTSGTNTWLRSLYFKDSNTGWTVGNNGIILMTEDGGDNWSGCRSFTSNTLNSIMFADDTTGWVVGESGTVLKMTMAEFINSVEDDPLIQSPIPKEIELSQNYPNPFNPKTTIEFSIPKTEFVTLKIYNLLGQEIASLAAKEFIPGRYTYNWDASDFAGGVYYYKIEAGNYTQTKKLILMK